MSNTQRPLSEATESLVGLTNPLVRRLQEILIENDLGVENSRINLVLDTEIGAVAVTRWPNVPFTKVEHQFPTVASLSFTDPKTGEVLTVKYPDGRSSWNIPTDPMAANGYYPHHEASTLSIDEEAPDNDKPYPTTVILNGLCFSFDAVLDAIEKAIKAALSK